MASPIFFDCFALDLGKGIHKLDTDTLKLFLTNATPDKAAHTVYSDIADLATAGGYTAGGAVVGVTWSLSGGLARLVPSGDPTFTGTTGFGPFRRGVLYNHTAAAKNLILYYDNGASVSVAAAATFRFTMGARLISMGAS